MKTTKNYSAGEWKRDLSAYPNSNDTLIRSFDGSADPTVARVLSSPDKSTVEEAANVVLIEAAPTLVEAALTALTVLENLTTADFALGGDKPARNALEAALKKAGVLS